VVQKVIIAASLLLVLAGCATSPVSGSLCSVGPFITDPGATQRLTRSEKEYQVTLNEAGRQICGWSPPSRG
jgi:hypothetical protein